LITVEFHNSKSSVWNAIQNSISKAGFIIANVSVLDKQKGTTKQLTYSSIAKHDLVISAYKPKESFEQKFLEKTGEGLEEEFIRMHLSHLPAEPSIERTEQMLYSKLLAYYVQHGYAVKYDAKTFYKMLHSHFVEEDGYWFNPDQLDAYREYKKKLKLEGLADVKKGQLNLFVFDEKSAQQWLYQFLDEPKDFKTIHPAFTKVANISGDQVPDLKELLEDNFVREGDKYRRPKSEEEKMTLIQKREKELLREFESLLLQAKASQKKIKECRKQAVLFGFEHCYKTGRFQDILTLAKRLDKRIVENDSEINDFIEVAELKVEGF
ncbi:DNA methylase, partial [candidate division KSB1 bacterium]